APRGGRTAAVGGACVASMLHPLKSAGPGAGGSYLCRQPAPPHAPASRHDGVGNHFPGRTRVVPGMVHKALTAIVSAKAAVLIAHNGGSDFSGGRMRLNRRKFIGSLALMGASAALPAARAQDGSSLFDMFSRDRVLRDRKSTRL